MIYTRTGDRLETSAIGGRRTSKSAPIIAFYGEIDSLNASLGYAASLIENEAIAQQIEREQRNLFVVPMLVMDSNVQGEFSENYTDGIRKATETLEHEIDEATEQLPVVADFILPGGCMAASAVGLSRTQCRRAERVLASLQTEYKVANECMAYINRLSDWLFVMSRILNKISNVEEKKLHNCCK